jgi:ubiquinone biosynthesis protein UbiJ
VLAHVAQAPINHVLRGESWALRRLQEFAGRTARIEAFPVELSFTVTDSGEVVASAPNVVADATFRLSPVLALRILSGDDAAYREVAVSGDADFAQAVEFVVRNARWDAEEDLARIFGDVAAHRIVNAGQGLMRMQARAAQSFSRNLADYLVEERGLIARRAEVESFVREVDTLRDDVERLSQRVARLKRPPL